MAYRGDDLELHTPQSWAPPAQDQGPAALDPYTNGARTRGPRTAQPILVDDVVLACCNHAFDVAVAHRASEVRLEHLLHAMTRIDGASNALEARGIRVSGLRRESATIIAGEIPIGVSAGQNRPRRSDDLEALLRSASSIAYRRNGPANIDDVLDALLDMPPELPGLALLARHGGRVARDRTRQRPQRDILRDREPLPLPPLSRPTGSFSDVRPADAPLETPRERLTPPAPFQSADYTRPLRPDALGSATDSIQNARLDQIENAVRALTTEVLTERKAVSSVVHELQRNLSAERDDANRFRGGLHDRIQSLETTVSSVANSDATGVLHDRMKSLEYAVLNTRKDDGEAGVLLDRLASVERGLEQRLNELARPWSVLSDRLQSLEQTVIETGRQTPADNGALHERMAMIERGIRDIQAGKGFDLAPISSRLDIIEEAVLSPDNSKAYDVLSGISTRLKALEEAFAGQRTGAAQAAASLSGDVKALASALAAQAASTERTHGLVTDRLQALTTGFDKQRTDSEQAVQARLAALENKLAESIQRNAEAQAAHTAELKEVHEALIKLNTNQHTLAGSIDQWRLDGVGDISVISKQLETIETSSAKPVALIEQLSANVDAINRVTAERHHRRERFWYWLFGTDDWLTASWPSQVASVEREQADLKSAGRSVPPVAKNGLR